MWILFSGMYAYGALVSKPESRATRLALFDGTESLFVVIGTLLSPIIKNNFGRYTNYGLKVGCTFLALLYIVFLVKEPPKSEEDKDKKQEKLTIITPLLSFVDLIKTVFKRLQKISYQMFLSASNSLFYFQSIKITLGPSDAESMRRLTQWPSVLYWRLLDLKG